MLAATILTLAFVPVFYALVEQLREGSLHGMFGAARERLESYAEPAE
jgi:hypothetical protein